MVAVDDVMPTGLTDDRHAMNRRFCIYHALNTEDKALADLLSSGSDERSVLGPDGLNKYGGAPYPRSVVPFGSCTASTISTRGWQAAHVALETYRKHNAQIGEMQASAELGNQIRERLVTLMGLADIPNLQLVLTPSGSDAEAIALFFASLTDRTPLVNIVVGAREVGSGTILAAGARHFSDQVPSGQKRTPGTPIDAPLADRTTVHQVKIRHDSSAERSPDDLDVEIQRIVESAVASGARVIVHIVAHSKTGVHAPRLETMNDLVSRYSTHVVPIIDAAQGRFSRRGLRDYLSRGFMVILTGSKFYGGTAFSGCLLVPGSLLPENQDTFQFPPGYSDYLTPAQLPDVWTAARASLPQRCNLGLMLRWRAAIAEIQAYYETPALARYRILRFFESQTPIILGRSPLLELINVPMPIFDDSFERLLESKTTVFSFRVKARKGYQIDQPTLARWIRWMNHDISAAAQTNAPEMLLQATRTLFQLGQAVHVGEQPSGEHDHVIRVAIGAILITDIATDPVLGPTLDKRLEWLAEKLEQLCLKIEFIADHATTILNLNL